MGSDPATIPPYIRRMFIIKPLPKNTLAGHHDGRRRARAQALHKTYGTNSAVAYVDAAQYSDRPHTYAVCAVPGPGLKAQTTSSSLSAATPTEAEEAAIALAVASTDACIVMSDSKTAITNFARGIVAHTTLKLLQSLQNSEEPRSVELIWVPAHAGNPGNEAAHQHARGFVSRAVGLPYPETSNEVLHSYHDITQYYRLMRHTRPAPHSKLNKRQEVTWRRLQTYSYPNPYVYSYIYPDR